MTDIQSNADRKMAVRIETAKESQRKKFMVKGFRLALTSGICYALYTAFLMVAETAAPWTDWYGDNNAGLSLFAVTFIIGFLASGLNDLCAGIWALIIAIGKGKGGDVFRCFKTKPGLLMIVCALLGGPGAGGLNAIAMTHCGNMAVPITACYPALGVLFSAIFLKQKMSPRVVFGVCVCLFASVFIGSGSVGDDVPDGMLLGCVIAFIAAIFWGSEGTVAGFSMTILDYEVGIVVRELSSGILNLGIVIPILCVINNQSGLYGELLGGAITSPLFLVFFVSGFFALFSYSLWYKGANMSGAALGMTVNSAYCFWSPLFCWLILGVFMGQTGWDVPVRVWIGAVIMFCGIVLIACNPLDILRKKEGKKDAAA